MQGATPVNCQKRDAQRGGVPSLVLPQQRSVGVEPFKYMGWNGQRHHRSWWKGPILVLLNKQISPTIVLTPMVDIAAKGPRHLKTLHDLNSL